MRSLPVSALLCAWLGAVREGHAGPDDLEDAVRGHDPRHLVVGLRASLPAGGAVATMHPDQDLLELRELPRVLPEPPRLALPVPGDLLGLGGPPALNLAALEAGEAVVSGPVALVPQVDARTVVWRAYDAGPATYVDERETALELRSTLTEVTRQLVDLDVASWQPEIPDLLMNLRQRPRLPLPPGLDPRRIETVDRAVLCLEIAGLALADEGGAVSAYEVSRRREVLRDLDRAARRALVGACSGAR
jgi:hypothetical protein